MQQCIEFFHHVIIDNITLAHNINLLVLFVLMVVPLLRFVFVVVVCVHSLPVRFGITDRVPVGPSILNPSILNAVSAALAAATATATVTAMHLFVGFSGIRTIISSSTTSHHWNIKTVSSRSLTDRYLWCSAVQCSA
jgi:hypothetical protein